MKKTTVAPIFLFLICSCGAGSKSQNEQSEFEKTQFSCNEYIRAYAEENNLDPFAEDVVKKLNLPNLTEAESSMNALLNQIESDYPGLTNEDTASSNYVTDVRNKYGAQALNSMQEFAQMFKDVDKLVRESCDSIELNAPNSVP